MTRKLGLFEPSLTNRHRCDPCSNRLTPPLKFPSNLLKNAMNNVLTTSTDLQVSLISSYATSGIWGDRSFREFTDQLDETRLGDRTVSPDLYLFMEPDVQYWLKQFGYTDNQRMSAIQFLADLSDENIQAIVTSMETNLDSVQPIAITTFLPEISLSYETKRAELVDRAILRLLKIAVAIGQKFGKTPVVQMVAGSVIDRIRSQFSSSKKREEFYVLKTHERECFVRILDRLSWCFGKLNSEPSENFDQLKVAFELEPGPLYLLDGPKSIVRFCDLIEDHACPHVKQKVGFNLDIAHWWLKNISPEFLDEYPRVQKRIFHSHIAGHSKRAHFGDISLTEMLTVDKPAYSKWLKALSKLPSEDGFSGYVSVEFEAARNSEAVLDSVNELFRLLDEPESV